MSISNQHTTKQILDALKDIKTEQKMFSRELKGFKHDTSKELKGIRFEQSNLREDMNAGFASLDKKLDRHHVASINADELLLTEIRTVREDVIFINRKVADTELDVLTLKQKN